MYTKEDLKEFKSRDIKREQIEQQIGNFRKGFEYIHLIEPATIGNGIKIIPADEENFLIDLYEKGIQKAEVVKMVPASGSATRMFKALFTFMETYTGSTEDFLEFVQDTDPSSMHEFFMHLNEFPFYARLKNIMWEDGKDLTKDRKSVV